MILLDGKAVAKQIRAELKEKIKNESYELLCIFLFK